MTATIVPPATTTQAAPVRRTAQPIPTARLVKVELRKMFDTRSGFWMLISIGVLSIMAAGSVLIFAPDTDVTYETFATAIGFPMRGAEGFRTTGSGAAATETVTRPTAVPPRPSLTVYETVSVNGPDRVGV